MKERLKVQQVEHPVRSVRMGRGLESSFGEDTGGQRWDTKPGKREFNSYTKRVHGYQHDFFALGLFGK